ncbi:hypothetical protein C1929_11240 [Stenotrophomonas sp. ZAC14D1_NAIMI4_6]|uniref:hypothetical protein n=1 Tax=Stenotrophomonas TaxID=40323 RepID=UPI0009A1E3B7|nr:MULTISPECIES: hypothetical protein [Stenotrophomonas]AWH37285.1 hypothetical protein C1929_11240 [Stenotrophomonas sp. ZAC14D1_NAIMI4_6]AWH41476.1 hypothetical protein C1927_11570 [Stenotrophomonas sp. ZAC14D1_NAIMI4_1]
MDLQPSVPFSFPRRPMPDSGHFELLDVNALQDPCSGRIVHLYALVARCTACETVFKAEEGAGLVSTSSARVVRCPAGCGQQAFSGAALRQWRAAAAPAA